MSMADIQDFRYTTFGQAYKIVRYRLFSYLRKLREIYVKPEDRVFHAVDWLEQLWHEWRKMTMHRYYVDTGGYLE
ncbi:MAG: hypothetical protein QW734_04665 [Candidatus Bathyarchaeia archaeon]